jgi:outer membrane protein assembly factor BamB
MKRGTRTRLTILLAAALVPIAGCSGGNASSAPDTGPASQSPSPPLRAEATLHVPAAGNVLTTHDRLWVVSGGRPEVTQVDPETSTITRRITLPHPVAYGTVAHGSLWLVSFGENALIELDAESGKLIRTLESSPDLPLNEPVGIAVTGHDMWVLNHDNSKLLRIDEQTGRLAQITKLRGDAAGGPLLVGQTLWVGMTAQGIFHQVDPTTGKIVSAPIHVRTGLCAGASIVGRDIWATSAPFGDFECTNGTSRFDTTSGEVTPLASAEDKSLYTFARYAGRLWATDMHKTVYQVDQRTGALRPAMTFDNKDFNHIFAGFGSLWMTRTRAGQLIRLGAT